MRTYKLLVWVFAILGILEISAFAQKIDEVHYDESKVPKYTLPDPLICLDGTRVTTPEQWTQKRRPELFNLFVQEMYGELPESLKQDHPPFVSAELMEREENALDGTAIRKQVALHFFRPNDVEQAAVSATDPIRKTQESLEFQEAGEDSKDCLTVNVLIYLPKKAEKPVPCFLMMNFRGNQTIWNDPNIFMSESFENGNVPEEKKHGIRVNRWDVDQILAAGYGLITLYYENLVPDSNEGFNKGLFALYGKPEKPSDWAQITAWAWGLSRVMDYIETDQEIDATRIAVAGHSRLGKTALWAGASDPRFALVISNDSGCGGAALSRREFGERVITMNKTLARWFCKNYDKYGKDVSKLPFDQHELIALIAPRPVYIASAQEDLWADPKGEYLAALNAVSVYKLLGTDAFGGVTSGELPELNKQIGGTIGYHIRTGKHDVTDFDWTQYIRFADKHFKQK